MGVRALGLAAATTLAMLFPTPALAQQQFIKDKVSTIIKKVGIHLGSNFTDPLNTKEARKDGSYSVLVGLAPGGSGGWSFPVGISWYTEDLVAPNGVVFGQLRARPFYGGVGYSWHVGKLTAGVELQAGWSINSLKPHGDPASAFHSVPAQIAMDVANSFSLRPQVKIEYFVTPKFTVRSALNYVLTNPRVMIGTPSGVLTDTWNASNVSLAVGVGYYPFRK